jgi:hypothetical protein
VERETRLEVNNPPSADTRTDELRTLRIENRLAAERIRQGRLARVRMAEHRRTQLLESMSLNWMPAYADYLDRITNRDQQFAGPTSRWQRARGQNYPIFQTEQELALLRAPARLLLSTNSYAIGLMEGLTSYVVGTGFTYRVAPKARNVQLPDGLEEACQAIVDEFLDRNSWHGGEEVSIEEELFQRSVGDGDCGLALYRQSGGATEARIVDADQITMPPGEDPREWLFGVLTDPNDLQRPLGYWVQFGPTSSDGEEFTPDEFLHLKRNAWRGIKRGTPDYSFDTGDALRLAGVLRENLTEGAAVQAAIVGVRQHESASQETVQRFVDDDADFTEPNFATGGTVPVRRARVGMEDVPKGLTYVAGPGAQNAAAHLAVLESCLRGAGVRWNAPEWLSTGTGSAINYASSLTTESPFIKTILRRQKQYREAFRRIVAFALQWAAECGRIRDANGNAYDWPTLQRLVDVQCEAPSPETRNLLEDAQRAAIEIPLGVDSRQQYAQRHGGDWDRITSDNRDWLAENGRTPSLELPPDPDPLAD